MQLAFLDCSPRLDAGESELMRQIEAEGEQIRKAEREESRRKFAE